MKNECNIVRDLMPLVIDGVASEESTQMVAEHVKDCEPCTKVYAEYQKNLPNRSPKEELDIAAKALRKWRRSRKALLIGATTLITLVVLFTGIYVWDALTAPYVNTLPLDEYEVRLVRMQDGQVKMIVLTDEPGLRVGVGGGGTKGNTVYKVKTSIIRQYGRRYMTLWEGSWQDGVFWADDDPGVGHIHQSIAFTDGENTRVIYTAGDDIPLASPEMEVLDALARSFYVGGKGNGLTDEQEAAYEAQYALVPEFQPE